MSPPSIKSLPRELVVFIATHLSIDEVVNFSLTCSHFGHLAQSDYTCKLVLEKTPGVRLTGKDGDHARALRIEFKRREALRSASPYLACIVAEDAKDYIFTNGVLCYISGAKLRIRDFYNSAHQETILDIRALHKHLGGTGNFWFRPLHYESGILSCLYARDNRRLFLALMPQENRILTKRPLTRSDDIFVRNNHQYLYFGIWDNASWDLSGFDISKGEWIDAGSATLGWNIGVTTCFEIIDDYLYGISVSSRPCPYTSYYSCFRFPAAEKPAQEQWRRQENEGMIDEIWSSMRLYKDEVSGHINVSESRLEKSPDGTRTRACYTSTVTFGDDGRDAEPGPRNRRPEDVHLADGDFEPKPTLHEWPLRFYHPTFHSFVDLVDGYWATPDDPGIWIRVDSRCPRSLKQEINDRYESRVSYWPERSASKAALDSILNLPGSGPICGAWDERSIVYGRGTEPKTLVFISFDPSIYIRGVPRFALEQEGSDANDCSSNTALEGPRQGASARDSAQGGLFTCEAVHDSCRGYHFASPTVGQVDGKTTPMPGPAKIETVIQHGQEPTLPPVSPQAGPSQLASSSSSSSPDLGASQASSLSSPSIRLSRGDEFLLSLSDANGEISREAGETLLASGENFGEEFEPYP